MLRAFAGQQQAVQHKNAESHEEAEGEVTTKLISLSAIVFILGVAGADARHRPANEAAYYGIQRISPTVDRGGWRQTQSGWDHSCFNINLPSQFACSANGG
jgi:hypothetical protein